jgi:SAM-dependent methyltransferase
MATKAWQLGSPETLVYRFFDWLRNGLNSKLAEYFVTRGIHRSDAVVLEAGSGPAFASSILARHPKIALSVAADIDLEALEQARLRDPALSLVVADLNHLPFRDEAVDLCWNSSTLEHLPDPSNALSEMARVVRKGGNIFVGVPYVFGPLGFQRLIRNTSPGIWIGETFSLKGLRDMMVGADLVPHDRIFYFFRFFVGVLAGKK